MIPANTPPGTKVRVIDYESARNFNAIIDHPNQIGWIKPDSYNCAEYIKVNFGDYSWFIYLKDLEIVSEPTGT